MKLAKDLAVAIFLGLVGITLILDTVITFRANDIGAMFAPLPPGARNDVDPWFLLLVMIAPSIIGRVWLIRAIIFLKQI